MAEPSGEGVALCFLCRAHRFVGLFGGGGMYKGRYLRLSNETARLDGVFSADELHYIATAMREAAKE